MLKTFIMHKIYEACIDIFFTKVQHNFTETSKPDLCNFYAYTDPSTGELMGVFEGDLYVYDDESQEYIEVDSQMSDEELIYLIKDVQTQHNAINHIDTYIIDV